MSARATQTINSGFGTFVKGDDLRGVPPSIVEAWAAAGIVSVDPEPAVETPAAELIAPLTLREDGSAELSDVEGNVELGQIEEPKPTKPRKAAKATRKTKANA